MTVKADLSPLSLHSSSIRRENPYFRTWAYTVLLAVFSAVAFFTNLGGSTLSPDEAQYALCVDHAYQSGNWLTFSPYPPEPYYQKPPMYFWLTGLTYRFFNDGVARYRFWSALFGVGCVGLTCVLGAMLFSPEAGLLGGLLLLTNHYFQVDHGARTGSMDTAVTFGAVLMLILYWCVRERRIAQWGWLAVGILSGLTSLFKPAAGVPMLGVIAIHAIAMDRKSGRSIRPFRGIGIACVVSVLVVAPYFFAVWTKTGSKIFTEMFQQELVDAAFHGDPGTYEHMFRNVGDEPLFAEKFPVQPWYALITRLHTTSVPFALAGVGIAFVLVAGFQKKHRSQYWLLAATAIIYLLLFSFTVVKRIRLIYPVFPEISLAIASSWIAAITWAVRRGSDDLRVTALTKPFACVCIVIVIFQSINIGRDQKGLTQPHFAPYNAYHELEPAITDCRARVIFYSFPENYFQWRKLMGLDASECFYLEHMPAAMKVNDPVQLQSLLAEGKPTLLLESRFGPPLPQNINPSLQSRSDSRFAFQHRAFSMCGVDTAELLQPRLSPVLPSKYIRLVDDGGNTLAKSTAGFEVNQRFVIRVLPPLRETSWITIIFAKPKSAADLSLRYHAIFRGKLLDWGDLGILSHEPRIALKVDRGQWAAAGPAELQVELLDALTDRPTMPVQAVVTEARLDVCPDPIDEK